jgi:hypothetical protein
MFIGLNSSGSASSFLISSSDSTIAGVIILTDIFLGLVSLDKIALIFSSLSFFYRGVNGVALYDKS